MATRMPSRVASARSGTVSVGVVCSFGVDVRASFPGELPLCVPRTARRNLQAKRSKRCARRASSRMGGLALSKMADTGIRIHAHDENVPFAPGTFEITDMTRTCSGRSNRWQNDSPAVAFVSVSFSRMESSARILGNGSAHHLGARSRASPRIALRVSSSG